MNKIFSLKVSLSSCGRLEFSQKAHVLVLVSIATVDVTFKAVANVGFPREGGAILFDQLFPKNCMKIKKFWPGGCASLAPLLRSASVRYHWYALSIYITGHYRYQTPHVCFCKFLIVVDTARLDIIVTLVPSDLTLPLRLGRQLQLACNINTDPAIDLSSSGWLYNDQPFYLFNNHKYVVYYTPASGKKCERLKSFFKTTSDWIEKPKTEQWRNFALF